MDPNIDVGLDLIKTISDTDIRDKLYKIVENINRELMKLQSKLREFNR